MFFKLKRSLKLKTIIAFCSLVFVGVAIGAVLGYSWGYRLILDTISKHHESQTKMLAFDIKHTFDEEVLHIKAFFLNRFFKEKLKVRNKQYVAKEDSIEEYLMQQDKKWQDDNKFVESYLNNEVSLFLKDVIQEEKMFAEIFVTDAYGGLFGASGKTTDYYQADEEWWQLTYNNGNGGVYIGRPEFDESSNTWGLPVVLPMKDEEKGVIGICKSILSITQVFKVLDEYQHGYLGHAIIVDDAGNLIYHKGYEPFSIQMFDAKKITFKDQSKKIKKFYSILHKKEMFMSYVKIDHPILLKHGVFLWAVVVSEVDEVMAPLKKYLLQGVLLIVLLFIMLIPMGIFLAGFITKPIKKLHAVIEKVSKQDKYHKITVKTQDEIGELAESFNTMLVQVYEQRKEIIKEKEKFKSLSKKLEQKVEERTKELSFAQTETLNILEDMKEAKQKLEENLEELKRKEDQLVQSAKLASLGKLVSDMAHEVNNPLMIISGEAEIALMEDTCNENVQQSFRNIMEECMRAKYIIQRLLKFSKPSKGDIKEIRINDSVEFVVKLLEHQYQLININIIRKYEKDLPRVCIDEKQMQEVFMNILKNAAEAMPDGGAITISTFCQKDKVAVVFEDSGEGIDEEDLKTIFDPFFTTKELGTGLGLSVCYGIVEAHGGELIYTSKKGAGTVAKVILPVKE